MPVPKPISEIVAPPPPPAVVSVKEEEKPTPEKEHDVLMGSEDGEKKVKAEHMEVDNGSQ